LTPAAFPPRSPAFTLNYSIIIPAHNEQSLLPGCLDSIAAAAQCFRGQVEVIVVLNRCTDGTERIAASRGATIVREEARNLARIRNAGASVARGEWLLTIDADSRMSPNMLAEAAVQLGNDGVVGGGTSVRPQRKSPGIAVTFGFLEAAMALTGLSAGAFWCRRVDFDAIGGFDERLHYAEDADFARRLRAHGRKTGRRYLRLPGTWIETSCRKFDRFGDWHVFTMMLRHPLRMRRALLGRDSWFTDRYYYDFDRDDADSAGARDRGS